MPSQLPLTAGVERAFLDQCRRLPEQVQTLLLVTAADDTGRVATLRQAAGNCGVRARAWVEAEQSSLLSVEGDVVAVKHPLVRSAVYQAATSLASVTYRRAMTADPADAADLFETALAYYRSANRPYDQARTQLAYGEFLRRTHRRVDARTHLRAALDLR